jgi:cysteine-rich repeat protein
MIIENQSVESFAFLGKSQIGMARKALPSALAALMLNVGCTLPPHGVPGDCGDGVLDSAGICAGGTGGTTSECGNGIVESGEACDDGNAIDTDGCDVSCELTDNIATPGDDRPGYVACAERTCGPGEYCCEFSTCLTDPTLCAHRYYCDGSEDCAPGERCDEGMAGLKGCNSGTSLGTYSMCHTSADCPDPTRRCITIGPYGGECYFRQN